ncbi:MAG: hypothetical protein OXG04_15795 [Acidobacteria bacterium]|nr:hypothetical protein [Acidobacteriota bacterium]
MKNVTITLPEDLARWVRIRAAEQDRSVSRWVAELLAGIRRQEDVLVYRHDTCLRVVDPFDSPDRPPESILTELAH